MTGKLAAIILSNYPFYMSGLDDLQENWNIIEKWFDSNINETVYAECSKLSFLSDLFPKTTDFTTNFTTAKETLKETLKILFAKTNKVLIKIIQSWPMALRESTFTMFSENVGDKLSKLTAVDEIREYCNTRYNKLYLAMTSARANIWKDDIVSDNDYRLNVEIATVVFMNSMFSYHGDYSKGGGQCFRMSFADNDIKLELETRIQKYGSLTKYYNPTDFISALLLNDQDPNVVDYDTAPMLSAKYFTIDDVKSYAEEYRKQSNRKWFTFADTLIGFDDNDTYSNQTFKRIIYNSVMQKVCNWTLFIPLNTFFDCSNINRIHREKNMKILPSDLGKYDLITVNTPNIEIQNLDEITKELTEEATKSRTLGKTLNINCMTMSNPPTEEEITRYNQITQEIKAGTLTPDSENTIDESGNKVSEKTNEDEPKKDEPKKDSGKCYIA